jgi:AbrB family looped-hinge helix DNA binding protein
MEEAEITTVSEKGQVVIPKSMRRRMRLVPKTKLLVYHYDDTLILKKLTVPNVETEMKALWKEIDKRIGKKRRLSDKEIEEEVHAHRREKGLLK